MNAAPPGIGPERRVVVATRSGQGELITLNEENGGTVEGPYAPLFPTEHAPIVTGTTIVIISSIGKLVGYDFAGQQRFSVPAAPLGVTGPIARAPDGSLRIATTSGRLLGFGADGSPMFDTQIGGAATSALAIAANGTTYAATDIGRFAGVDMAGGIVLDVNLEPPASGPSIDPSSGKIAVGEATGFRVFDSSGTELFKHPRAARVTGTRFLENGEIIAWGEDGIFELLDSGGAIISSFNAVAPIYASAVPIKKNGRFAVLPSNGIAYSIDRNGGVVAQFDMGEAPLAEVAQGELGYVFVAVGKFVRALDYAFE